MPALRTPLILCQGAVAMLRAMLELLLEWASELRLPVPEPVWQKAIATLERMDFPGDYMAAIESVLDNLGTPALILWGKWHANKPIIAYDSYAPTFVLLHTTFDPCQLGHPDVPHAIVRRL